MNKKDKPSASVLRTLGKVALVVAIVIIYAYGLQVTKVDLEKPQEAKRQEQLTNILRGLANPDLFAWDIERVEADAPVLIPCAGEAPTLPPPVEGRPYITLSTNCAQPGDPVTVSGFGWQRNEDVFLYFVPYSANKDDEVELKLVQDRVATDDNGAFTVEATLKSDRLSDNPATIRAVANRKSGFPRPSEALIQTWDKIIETVFLALIATTLGIFLAVPFSFLAARNLMSEVNSTFVKFMASMAVVPIGGYLGYLAFNALTNWGRALGGGETASLWLWAVAPAIVFAAVKSSGINTGQNKLLAALKRIAVTVVITVVAVVILGVAANFGRNLGMDWKPQAGLTGVFGNLILILSDAILLGLPVLGFLIGFFILSSLAGSVTEMIEDRASDGLVKILAIILAALAGVVWFGAVSVVLNWLYQFGELRYVIIAPSVIGAVLFAGLAIAANPHRIIPTGMFIYYVIRTIMNIFRSIEPLVMVVAFAVWVGIGPFAGVMALGLHTIVALGKLYSEQVENIAVGPLEAVTATGANRLQMIVYAVIPQIVPPYIAFTLYRWDINVRMSTIIGFGGGGGIGFLLSQNINLLKYRQASVNMIAIAIVVASLDYISAKVREKIT